jgi:ribosomal protein L16 Arg81 hydroxylase
MQPILDARRTKIDFSDITTPIGRDRFFSTFWTRQAVHLKQDGRTFDEYFGWEALNTILNAGNLVFPKIKVSRSDRPIPSEEFTTDVGGHRIVDPRAVLNLFQDGASFGVTGADSYWAPLRSVVDGIYDELLESVHANVYCSPPRTQGFQCHFDLHEVFVLQVEGEKHWRVFRPTTDAPVQGWRPEDAPSAPTEPYLDVILSKGDILYVPRGHWHYAVVEDSISLHLTMGVTCRKGTAFLDWLASELSGDPIWRRNAPLMNTSTSGGAFTGPAGLAEWGDGLRRSMVEKLSEADVFERFCREVLDGIRPTRNVEMPIQVTDDLPVATLVFERPVGRRHFISGSGQGAVAVTVGGSEMQLEGVDPGLVRTIFDSDSFTLAELRTSHPDVPANDVSELIGELVRSGLLLARQRDSGRLASS